MTCTKVRHQTVDDARIYHQIRSNKAYYVYWCNQCGAFHVSTNGLGDKILGQMLEMIIEREKAYCVKKISNRFSLWEVYHPVGNFLVKYDKTKKRIEVVKEVAHD